MFGVAEISEDEQKSRALDAETQRKDERVEIKDSRSENVSYTPKRDPDHLKVVPTKPFSR
jgi:hypothetical protein